MKKMMLGPVILLTSFFYRKSTGKRCCTYPVHAGCLKRPYTPGRGQARGRCDLVGLCDHNNRGVWG